MRNFLLLASAVSVLALGAGVANATDLVHGVHYGTGNDYTPENWTVVTNGGIEDALRGHQNGQPANAPGTGGVYTLALGQDASFDFSLDPSVGTTLALLGTPMITITNEAGGSASFSPFILGGNTSTGVGGVQNSEALHFGFLNGSLSGNVGDINYDANVNSTYDVMLTAGAGDSLVTNSIKIVQGKGFIGTGAVPEPASWALMMIGFGGIGAALRRRRSQMASTAFA